VSNLGRLAVPGWAQNWPLSRHYRIYHFSHVGRSGLSARFFWGNQGFENIPLFIADITWIGSSSHHMPLSSPTILVAPAFLPLFPHSITFPCASLAFSHSFSEENGEGDTILSWQDPLG